jgi:hypothetical protein
VLWANNLHIVNYAIKETSTGRNQTDSRSTNVDMKRITKIGIWNARGRAGVKSRSWPEIGSDGDVLLVPYVPKGIIGDDDSKEYLPVHYRAQKSSWMDEETFLDWFTPVFVPEVEKNIKNLGRPQKPNCMLLLIILK